MERKIKLVTLDNNLQEMLISSVRYALGRRTYMPEWTVQYITPLLPYFFDRELSVMQWDVYEWLNRYAEGEPDDIVKTWQQFFQSMQREQRKRRGA